MLPTLVELELPLAPLLTVLPLPRPRPTPAALLDLLLLFLPRPLPFTPARLVLPPALTGSTGRDLASSCSWSWRAEATDLRKSIRRGW